MKIVSAKDVVHVIKPQGTDVRYYLFDEYEVHYNEQLPHTSQVWHHHDKIWETIYIIEGELLAKWSEENIEKEQLLNSGDVVETERNPHTFINNTDKITKFLVIKQLLSGENKKDLLKNDKVIDKVA